MSDIGSRLDLYRSHKALSRPEFAEALGVSASLIRKVIRGERQISADLLQRLADKWSDLDLNWLLRGEGYPHKLPPEEEAEPMVKIRWVPDLKSLTKPSHELEQQKKGGFLWVPGKLAPRPEKYRVVAVPDGSLLPVIPFGAKAITYIGERRMPLADSHICVVWDTHREEAVMRFCRLCSWAEEEPRYYFIPLQGGYELRPFSFPPDQVENILLGVVTSAWLQYSDSPPYDHPKNHNSPHNM